MVMNVGSYFSPYSVLHMPNKNIEITLFLCVYVCLNKKILFCILSAIFLTVPKCVAGFTSFFLLVFCLLDQAIKEPKIGLERFCHSECGWNFKTCK